METKALFFDIDGTLVSFETHRVPQSTVDALTAAKARGVQVYIATGRPLSIIHNIGQIESLIDGYVTTNGALCLKGQEVIARHAIPWYDVQTMVREATAGDFPVIIVGESRCVVHNFKEQVDRIFRVGLGVDNIDYSESIDDIRGEDILQMTPFVNETEEERLMSLLPSCISGRWHPEFTDVTSKEADKGHGLQAMALHEGLDINETMAFGDGCNDIPLIQAAGIGIAMGNAGTGLKAVADYVTTSVDDDGVARALRHFQVID